METPPLRSQEDLNPNTQLTPYFDGEKMIWIPVVEYYSRHYGQTATKLMEVEHDEEFDSTGA